eukprot:1158246-Pelagomonas_calceolata.AAC.7
MSVSCRTWLPAPTLSYAPKKVSSNKILDFFANCPDNAFQKVRPGTDPFSLGQRFGAIARNGLKLLGVGFFASLLGGLAGLTLWKPRERGTTPVWACVRSEIYLLASDGFRVIVLCTPAMWVGRSEV